MYKVFILNLFFCCISISSFTQNKLKDGNTKFYYENGTVSSEGTIKNGKPEGYWFTYYPSGLIKSEGNRKNYLLDSTWIFYNERGEFKTKINYKKGLKEGLKIYYSDSCNIILEENFIADIKQNFTFYYYDEPGKLISKKIPFLDGVEDGIAYEYGKDGRIITISVYKKGTFIGNEKINRFNKKNEKDGIWKKFYKSGKLKQECRYKNDLLNGYLKDYDQQGKLINAILYINGVPQSFDESVEALDIRREFYDDASIKKEGAYDVNGKEHGNFNYYDKNGNVEKTEIYHHGILLAKGLTDEMDRRQGYWEEYYFDGQLKSKGKYLDGLKIDEWEYYFNNGELEQKGKYLAGEKFTGLWKWYHPNGELLREENFRKGLEDGFMYEYYDDGTLITKGEFIDGLKEGPWFYEMGDHREEGEYRSGVRSGIWKYYFDNDKLNFEGNFIDGVADGKHKFYFKSGKLWREEYYLMGNKVDTWKTYNELGEIVLNINFKDGKEYKIDGTKLK
jgi:antitoxin component YwqK of YwqJK toxin-antitoxin module